jgi:hypothetical protein
MHGKFNPDLHGILTVGCQVPVATLPHADTIALPPVSATPKRGKCMSRRAGQNPSVRIHLNRRKGIEEYFFQYWIDVPGRKKRKRENGSNRTDQNYDEERGGKEEIGIHIESEDQFK